MAPASPKAPTVGVLPTGIPGLVVISPSHEMNMTHTKSLNLKRYGYIYSYPWSGRDFVLPKSDGLFMEAIVLSQGLKRNLGRPRSK